MKQTMKKMISVVLVFGLLFCLSSCAESPKSSISGLKVQSLADRDFYIGITHCDLGLTVEGTTKFTADDFNVVVKDNSIIDIVFRDNTTYVMNGILFDIECKSPGTTSFYFETIDKTVKSEEVEITIAPNPEIWSIKFSNDAPYVMIKGEDRVTRKFMIDSKVNIAHTYKYLEFISENPEVVTVEYNMKSNSDECVIKRVGAGETYVYLQTNDKKVQSQKIKITVE